MTSDIAKAIKEALNGITVEGLGEFEVSSLGNVISGRIVGRDRLDLRDEANATEFHAVIKDGPLEL